MTFELLLKVQSNRSKMVYKKLNAEKKSKQVEEESSHESNERFYLLRDDWIP